MDKYTRSKKNLRYENSPGSPDAGENGMIPRRNPNKGVVKNTILSLGFCACLALAALALNSIFNIWDEHIRYEIRDRVAIGDGDIPLAGTSSKVLTPDAPGKSVAKNTSATIDYSNTSEGYVMVKYTGTSGKVKLQISKNSKKTYTYNLSRSGKYETFPLASGDGRYSVTVFENVSGDQYAQALSSSVDVKLKNSTIPFLYPNQYVDFTKTSEVVKKSNSLAEGTTTQVEIVSKVYNYVISNLTYDEQKAKNVKSGYLPVVDDILSAGKGICFDYASVMCAMIRAQGIPARLEVGYVSGGAYHAWISVYTSETGWINNVIYFDGKTWKMMDPTFASSGKQSASIMKYIGNGSNYSTQYVY